MPDNDSKTRMIPADDLPRDHVPERGELTGPLDVPQQDRGENFVSLEDRMMARRSLPIRHIIPDTDVLDEMPAQQEIREGAGLPPKGEDIPANVPARKSESIWRRRWNRFKGLKRGFYSLIILLALYLVSFLLPLLVNNKAVAVHYNGDTYFPAFADLFDFLPGVESFYPSSTFGQVSDFGEGEADYRELDATFEAEGGDNWVLMPLHPWNPNEFDDEINSPAAPDERHILGTDDSGRDVFARLTYGFNVSISFALVLVAIEYLLGIALGAIMGYFGGKVDLVGQRFVEIWENIPFLYTVIIISAILKPSFIYLVLILAIFQWIGISYYIRGEFFREKAKDYVAAAISLGASTPSLIFRHVLPNSLTPIITFFPFALIGGISALVGLDFLGFGLPITTPSWGELIRRGLENLEHGWLVIPPLVALFFTLMLVTFIGEAVRAAFDPKVFSRLR